MLLRCIEGDGPISALIAGPLAEIIGVRTTIGVGLLGILASAGWLICSPIRTLWDRPAPTDEAAPAPGLSS